LKNPKNTGKLFFWYAPSPAIVVRNVEQAENVRRKRRMDVLKMLADLRREREQIEEAILTLERLAQGRGRRRGRPPAWMAELKRRGRPAGSKTKPKETAAA
jgi:hypothetical protein